MIICFYNVLYRTYEKKKNYPIKIKERLLSKRRNFKNLFLSIQFSYINILCGPEIAFLGAETVISYSLSLALFLLLDNRFWSV